MSKRISALLLAVVIVIGSVLNGNTLKVKAASVAVSEDFAVELTMMIYNLLETVAISSGIKDGLDDYESGSSLYDAFIASVESMAEPPYYDTIITMEDGSKMTVKEALDTIRIKAEKENMELYYVYVVDKNNHLVGVASLRNLITTPTDLNISDIMSKDLVKVHVDDYQGHIADIFMKYQFNALPVVDLYNHLKGIVTWDDVQDIVEEETTDEILTSSGIVTDLGDEDDDILTGSLAHSIKARIPWLFITLIGEFIAVTVTNKYDKTFTALPIIAAFMPLLAGLGGNIGTQSITLMVRGMSTGQITLNSGWHQIIRETITGLSIGVIFGLLVTFVTWGWQHNLELGLIVGIAMSLNMTIATMIGTCTPLVLKKMKIDPAVASGPVIATTIDVIGLAVYLTLVTWYLISI